MKAPMASGMLAWKALVKPSVAMLVKKMVPISATPTAPPSCWEVLKTPEAHEQTEENR